MSLIHGKSKKSFNKNVETEMKSGKPMDQSLAIAYNVQKKARHKKYAKGGKVNESANTEVRPSPEELDHDRHEVARNSSIKPAKHDGALDRSTVVQAQANNSRKVQPIKHPRMVPSSVFTARLRDEEDHLMESAKPGLYGEQPPRHDDEEGADRQGPESRDLHMKMMAKGGKVDRSKHEKGVHKKDSDSKSEGRSPAGMLALHADNVEEFKDAAVDEHERVREESRKIKPKLKGLAEGGMIDDSLDHELDMEHRDSIAAAIMAKKDRERHMLSDSDMDEMQRLYEGGEVNGHDSLETHEDVDQADLARNAEEDANMEDQASFDALRKENYSESEGLEQLDSPEDSNLHGDEREDERSDKHDMVEAIHRKMMTRRQFKQR